MPGILGIFGSENARAVFPAMISKLNHFDYAFEEYHAPEFSIGRIHLGFVNTEKQPIFSGDHRYGVVMIGEIFSYDSTEIPDIKSDARFLLDKFIQYGTDCFVRINGQFTAAICDTLEKRIILVSDRYGTRPLYFRVSGPGLMFAPEVKALCEDKQGTELNYAAISELFHIGFLFGTHTIFKNVQQLPPASYLEFKNKRYSIKRYWEYPYLESVYHQTKFSTRQIRDFIGELQELYKNVIRRQSYSCTKDLLLPLSGGLDSRWVAALLKDIGLNDVQCFTMGEHNTDDVVYAKKVAQLLNFPHKSFPISPLDVWKNAGLFSYVSDGMSKISGPVQMAEPLKAFIGQKKIVLAPQVVDALFGSTLYRPSVASLIGKYKFTTTAKQTLLAMFDSIDDGDISRVLARNFYNRLTKDYQQTINAYIERYPDPMHAYFCVFLEQFGRRGTFGGNLLYNLFLETRMPSYDNDLIEYGFRLPIKLRKGQFLYRQAFTQKFPDLACVPRDKSGLPIYASNTRIYFSQVKNTLIKKMKKTPLRKIHKRVNKWNKPHYVEYDKWFRNELWGELSTLLLDKKTLDRDIIDRAGLTAVLEEHRSARKDHSALLWQLINLEYIYRNYLD